MTADQRLRNIEQHIRRRQLAEAIRLARLRRDLMRGIVRSPLGTYPERDEEIWRVWRDR